MAVAAFGEGDLPGFAVLTLFCEGDFAEAVGELDAVVRDGLLVEGGEGGTKSDLVDFGFLEFGVGVGEGEVAVAGEQDEAGAVFVEAADGF